MSQFALHLATLPLEAGALQGNGGLRGVHFGSEAEIQVLVYLCPL